MATAPVRVFKSFLRAKYLNSKPASVTSSTVTLGDKHSGGTVLLNRAAGVAVTLPAASGTGQRFKVLVGTASNANTIRVTGNDTFVGGIMIQNDGDSSAATADAYTPAAANNRISPTTAGGGGAVGDWMEFHDVAADKWQVFGYFSGVGDPVTPFSTT